MLVEICCGGVLDGLNAYKEGVKRIELNSALFLGGLTPSTFDLVYLKENTSLEIITMVRCRGDGFCFNDEEFELMLKQAEDLLTHGADGIAFGFLNEDKTIHKEYCIKMVNLIHKYNKTAVFHRAIDITKDIDSSIKTLIDIKVDRILTSGQKKTAILGVETIAKIQKKYGNQIEILAGSGITSENVIDFVNKTKVKQIHASCKVYKKDNTCKNNDISFAYNNLGYEVVDRDNIKDLLNVFK